MCTFIHLYSQHHIVSAYFRSHPLHPKWAGKHKSGCFQGCFPNSAWLQGETANTAPQPLASLSHDGHTCWKEAIFCGDLDPSSSLSYLRSSKALPSLFFWTFFSTCQGPKCGGQIFTVAQLHFVVYYFRIAYIHEFVGCICGHP